jgi:DNA polymerase-1
VVTKPAPERAAGEQRDRLLPAGRPPLATGRSFPLPAKDFSATTSQPTSAVYGFTAMLIRHAAATPPRGRRLRSRRAKAFRHEQWVSTRRTGGRPQPTSATSKTLIFEVLDALGISVGAGYGPTTHRHPGQAEQASLDVLIVTGDRD